MKKILFIIFSLLIALPVSAATLYFKPENIQIGVGETGRMELFLDSPENVNALEGKIIFPADLLEVKNLSDGNSIINLWITKPRVENNSIIFAGIIPGGYPAFGGKILTVDFLAKKSLPAGRQEAEAVLQIKEAQALLNDGKGTAASLSLKPITFEISTKPTGMGVEEMKDDIPPEDFLPSVSSDPSVFDGQYFVIFAAQDKGSGIDYYEVSEKKGFLRPEAENWVKAESPYLLSDQKLESWIFVKAVDKKGNERIAIIHPANVIIDKTVLTIILGISVIVLLLVGRLLWRHRRV